MVQWRDIPGNSDVFDQLSELLASGDALAFVGAGASAGLYPLWPQLIRRLAEKAVQAGADPDFEKVWTEMDALAAARQIRKALGEGTFAEEIREIFGPKAEAPRYTPVHAALARLGFYGFATTNYDPALTFACQDAQPEALVQAFDWRHDRVALWLQGRPGSPGELPILHAHGQYDSKDSLVLDALDYRRAYGDDRYRRLFERLWTSERLVVVGFGFRDPWLRIVAEEALSRAGAREVSRPRHVALIGLPADDVPAAVLHRDALEEPYHLRVLFYPVVGADHSALGSLLEELLAAAPAAKPAPSQAAAEPAAGDLRLKVWDPPEYSKERPYPLLLPYSHPDLLAGRERELAELRYHLSRPIPILGLYAPSGAGKSSLLRAALVPALRAEGVPVAFDDHPHETGLGARLVRHLLVRSAGENPAVGDDVQGFVEHVKAARRLAGVPPVLVLDQFEDVFDSTAARAEVGVLLAATIHEQLRGEEPLCRWLLAHRQDFHGDLKIWLQDALAEARQAGRPVEGLPWKLLEPERFQAWSLPLLGAPSAGSDDVAEPLNAFLAAIEKPLGVPREDGTPRYPIRFAGDGARRLAHAFAEERLSQRQAALTPELQVVLAYLLKGAPKGSDGYREVQLEDEPRSLIANALGDHLDRVLHDAFPTTSRPAARRLRTRALLALRELADAQGRTDQGLGASLLAAALGEDGDKILDRLAAPDARLIVSREDADDPAGKRYVLSHDRLAKAVVDAVEAEGARLDVDAGLLRLGKLVTLNAQLHRESGQVTELK